MKLPPIQWDALALGFVIGALIWLLASNLLP